MKKFYISHLIICITIGLAALLSGCGLSNGKFGDARIKISGSNQGKISYDYNDFSGFERGSIRARTGQRISLDYRAVISKGGLIIEWQDPHGEIVWRKTLEDSQHGEDEIEIATPGENTLVIQGKGTTGNFDISWKLD